MKQSGSLLKRITLLALCVSLCLGIALSASAASLRYATPADFAALAQRVDDDAPVAKETTRLTAPKKFSLYLGEFKRFPITRRYRGTPDGISIEYERDDRVQLATYYMQLFMFGRDTGSTAYIIRSGTKRVNSTVTVKYPPTTGIEIDGNFLELNLFESFDITRAVFPYTALNQLRWSSDNPRVASVSSNGVAMGRKPGVAIINAKTKAGSKFVGSVLVVVG